MQTNSHFFVRSRVALEKISFNHKILYDNTFRRSILYLICINTHVCPPTEMRTYVGAHK